MPPFFRRVCLSLVLLLAADSLGAAVLYSINGTIQTAAPDSPLQVNDTFLGSLEFSASENALADNILTFDEADVAIQLTLNFAGIVLSENDDPANSFPAVYLGDQLGIDFFSPLGDSYPEGSFLQIYPDNTLLYSLNGVDEFEGTLAVTQAVPESSILLSSFGGFFFLILARRRS